MDFMVVVSAVVLGLSVLATLAKFLDWFLHSDPRTMVRTTRWMLFLLLLALVLLIGLAIAREHWTMAMLLGAAALGVSFFVRWRALLAPVRAAFAALRPRSRPFDMEIWQDPPDDPRTVQRAAAILEAYVGRASLLALRDGRRRDGAARTGEDDDDDAGVMTRGEALEVLGLEPGAEDDEILAAHRRLVRLVHPGRGGSAWLVERVYEARDVLLEPRVEERDEKRSGER